jgi:hypothetical protein
MKSCMLRRDNIWDFNTLFNIPVISTFKPNPKGPTRRKSSNSIKRKIKCRRKGHNK